MKFLKYIANEIEEKRLVIPGFYPDWAKATLNIIRIIFYAITFVMIFQLLPWSDSTVFQGVSVFIGLLISLGSTSVISNLIAGLVITYMRPFIQGDRIRIGDTYGDVVEKTPFVVRVLTPKNEVVTVPNATVLSANVINYSFKTKDRKDAGVVVYTTVTIGYDVPWMQVQQLLIDAALKTPLVLHKPNPFVLQTALNDFSISYQINAYTKDAPKMPIIYSELFKNIQDIFRDAGIELMTPHYQAYRDGNQALIPPVFSTPESKNNHSTTKDTKEAQGTQTT
jgi:small-conductance mechanosensitive channel